MIKHKTILEIKKEERTYQFLLENDAPLGELFDVLSQMRYFIYERIKQAEEADKEKSEPKGE